LLALMASGLNGQRFAFHGYLPVESVARANRIVELEKLSISLQQTQIFIEAPYRNQKLLEQLVKRVP
jgi:16S rRNA (cytidine1402-2'-O)-methyltransferase